MRADHRNFDVDDTLCHNVARVLTSLIESKNSATGLLGYAAMAERTSWRDIAPPTTSDCRTLESPRAGPSAWA